MIKVSRQPGQWAEPPAQELGKSLLEQKEKPRRWTPGITRIHRLHWIHRIHPVCWWCYVMLCDVWYVWWRRTSDIILWVRLKGQDIFSFCFYWKILKDIESARWCYRQPDLDHCAGRAVYCWIMFWFWLHCVNVQRLVSCMRWCLASNQRFECAFNLPFHGQCVAFQ